MVSPPAPASNLEVKIAVPDLASVRKRLASLQPKYAGLLNQTDIYFNTRRSRLKLRLIEGESAQLICYDRLDAAEVRTSSYHLVPCAEPDLLLQALTQSLGIRCRVVKVRELHLWHNVRIHLDRVTGLGDFLELEAVLSAADDVVVSQQRLTTLLTTLGITSTNFLTGSYADMISPLETPRAE